MRNESTKKSPGKQDAAQAETTTSQVFNISLTPEQRIRIREYFEFRKLSDVIERLNYIFWSAMTSDNEISDEDFFEYMSVLTLIASVETISKQLKS